MPRFEYRIGASVNVAGVNWHDDWWPWEGDEQDPDEIKERVGDRTFSGEPAGNVSLAMERALEMSGLDAWVEVREI